jgi:hypothetical protein
MSAPLLSSEPPFRKKVPAQRSVGSRVKISVGGVGFALCALWWPLMVTMLFLPDPAPNGLHFNPNSDLTILTVSLLLTVLFLVILRSGLRGPTDPLAPDESKAASREPSLPLDSNGNPGSQPKSPSRKKRHLRLV